MNEQLIQQLKKAEETVWMNPGKDTEQNICRQYTLGMADIEDAESRLKRFAPFIQACFPETAERKGLIESQLMRAENLQKALQQKFHCNIPGNLWIKLDSHLPIAGSVKARGGIYEVLKHAEELALEHHVIEKTDNYSKLCSAAGRDFFSQYTVQVGSTGNLGLSIGIMSAALGFRVIVHMSADAKEWKKNLLRQHGVIVKEYDSDYSEAVKQGRTESMKDDKSYFIDDENSKDLFLGYAVAGKRLKQQLDELHVPVDKTHPLFLFIPCGVGGAPGGISFGCRKVFGDDVHCFFVEPVQAPCMLLGLASGLHHDISVQDIGLSGKTNADGLAVGRPSGFVGKIAEKVISGEFTVSDSALDVYMKLVWEQEHVFLEPSACAAFHGVVQMENEKFKAYLKDEHISDYMEQATCIAWATGGSMVPPEERLRALALYK